MDEDTANTARPASGNDWTLAQDTAFIGAALLALGLLATIAVLVVLPEGTRAMSIGIGIATFGMGAGALMLFQNPPLWFLAPFIVLPGVGLLVVGLGALWDPAGHLADNNAGPDSVAEVTTTAVILSVVGGAWVALCAFFLAYRLATDTRRRM